MGSSRLLHALLHRRGERVYGALVPVDLHRQSHPRPRVRPRYSQVAPTARFNPTPQRAAAGGGGRGVTQRGPQTRRLGFISFLWVEYLEFLWGCRVFPWVFVVHKPYPVPPPHVIMSVSNCECCFEHFMNGYILGNSEHFECLLS